MDCSTSGFPVLHFLLELAQTHVHWVDDAIQPSHPLSPPSPPALKLSQHQGVFQWVGCLYHVHYMCITDSASASVLLMNILGWFPLGLTACLLFLLFKGLSRVFSWENRGHSTTVEASILWRSAFFTVQLWQLYMTTGKTIALTIQTFVGKVMSLLFDTYLGLS